MAVRQQTRIFGTMNAMQLWLLSSNASWDKSRLPYVTDVQVLDGTSYRISYVEDFNGATDTKAFTEPGLFNAGVVGTVVTAAFTGTALQWFSVGVAPGVAAADTVVAAEAQVAVVGGVAAYTNLVQPGTGVGAGTAQFGVTGGKQVVPGTFTMADAAAADFGNLSDTQFVIPPALPATPDGTLYIDPTSGAPALANFTSGTINYATGVVNLALGGAGAGGAVTVSYSYNAAPQGKSIPPACVIRRIEVELLDDPGSVGPLQVFYDIAEDSAGHTTCTDGSGDFGAGSLDIANTGNLSSRVLDNNDPSGWLSVIQDPQVANQGQRWVGLNPTGSAGTYTFLIRLVYSAL